MNTPSEIIDLLRERNIPFAMYRLPGELRPQLMVQYASYPMRIADLSELPDLPGFLIAPFPVNGGEETFLLQPDLIGAPEQALDLAGDALTNCELFADLKPPLSSHISTSEEVYTHQVRQAVEAIHKGEFYKVILSKNKIIDIPEGFRPEKLFDDLCVQYPDAFVYYWQLPGAGSWMGATPEILMREVKGRISTLSLAGTQLYEHPDLEEYCWRAKEIAEQAIVSRFIVQLLDKMGVEQMGIEGPQNFRAGNLVHLATLFSFNADNLRVSRGRFIAQLHPTPAVAGLPRDESLNYIRSAEAYNRSYYSGLVGPLMTRGETHLFVNLRCMQLFDNHLVLYSGAGITGSSIPEKEWTETENKMKTLLNVIVH